jgi:hypothetical protein
MNQVKSNFKLKHLIESDKTSEEILKFIFESTTSSDVGNFKQHDFKLVCPFSKNKSCKDVLSKCVDCEHRE